MIWVYQHPDEAKRGGRGCPWIAECEVGGVTYTARSRSGAPYALARVLVEAGIPDAPMVVITHGLEGETRYRSFHEMAGYTIKESATQPVHLARWKPFEEGVAAKDARSALPSGSETGGKRRSARVVAPDELRP